MEGTQDSAVNDPTRTIGTVQQQSGYGLTRPIDTTQQSGYDEVPLRREYARNNGRVLRFVNLTSERAAFYHMDLAPI